MDVEQPRDCTRCGACCFSESVRHARVTGDDHARMGDDAERMVEWVGNEAFMRLARVAEGLHRCTALVIDPVSATFMCSIYETRPDICRDLAQGSGGCHGELHAKSDRARRSLVVLADARRAAPAAAVPVT